MINNLILRNSNYSNKLSQTPMNMDQALPESNLNQITTSKTIKRSIEACDQVNTVEWLRRDSEFSTKIEGITIDKA